MAPKSLGKGVRIHTKVHAPLAVQRAAQKRLVFRIGLGEECSPSIPCDGGTGATPDAPFHLILEVLL
jgi:hypothetical protein